MEGLASLPMIDLLPLLLLLLCALCAKIGIIAIGNGNCHHYWQHGHILTFEAAGGFRVTLF